MKRLISLCAVLSVVTASAQRRVDRAPSVGDPIPKVSAVTLSEHKEVDLSSPEKVTVLIFGSHT